MKAKASKKHAKPTRQAKGGKFHHKMKHHFDDGGDIDVGDIDVSSPKPIPNIDDAMSRGTAYKMARAAGKKTFNWRGNIYTTESAEEAAARKAASAPSAPSDASFTYAPGSWRDKTASAPSAASAPSDAPTQRPNLVDTDGYGGPSRGGWKGEAPIEPGTYSDYAKTVGKGLGAGLAVFGGAPELIPEIFGAGSEGYLGAEGAEAYAGLARSARARKAALAKAAQIKANRPIQDVVRDATARGAGYKKGGKIHKYATGGSIRGSGCESKGKTKGTHR